MVWNGGEMIVRRAGIVLTMILCMLGVCGCTMEQGAQTDKDAHKVVLSERQIQILEQEGLPIRYEELSPIQQETIIVIEEMMTAVEEKYGEEFAYFGYFSGSVLESGTLTLYPKGGDPSTDAFSVQRAEVDGAYIYTDGYAAMQKKPGFIAFVEAYAEQQLGDGTAAVYCVVFESEESSCVHGDGDCWIFVDGGSVSREQFAAFAAGYGDWKRENGITGFAQLILLKPDVLRELTEFNYSDYLGQQYSQEQTFVGP